MEQLVLGIHVVAPPRAQGSLTYETGTYTHKFR